MTLKQANGQPVPFGATVSDSDPEAAPGSSIVGDGGQVYLSGVSPQGSLQVKWGSGEQCRVSYQLPQTTQPDGISQMEGACR
jgi:outer membrane usher protein